MICAVALTFMKEHPRFKELRLRKRRMPTVPKMIGRRVPNRRLIDSNDAESPNIDEERAFYASTVLVMFKPFRTLNDLIPDFKSTDTEGTVESLWWPAFVKFEQELKERETRNRTLSPSVMFDPVLRYLRFIQEYHETFSRSNDTDLTAASEEKDNNGDGNALEDDDYAAAENASMMMDDQNYVNDVFRVAEETHPLLDRLAQKKVVLNHVTRLSWAASSSSSSSSTSIRPVDINSFQSARSQLERLKKQPFRCTSFAENGVSWWDELSRPNESDPNTDNRPFIRRATIIRFVADAILHIDPTVPVVDLNQSSSSINTHTDPALHRQPANRPTIAHVSREWKLNTEQHYMFTAVAACLLDRILCVVESEQLRDSDRTSGSLSATAIQELQTARANVRRLFPPAALNNVTAPQLIMLMHGAGGTGKSQVIKALMDFARRWHALSMLSITATSGAAAVNIGGMTYHSALGLKLQEASSKISSKKATKAQIAAWERVAVLVIDELSLLTVEHLYLIDQRLRKMRPAFKDLPFGCVHLLLCGDFFQLKCIGHPLYINPVTAYGNDVTEAARLGHDLWRSLNFGIELTQPMRQSAEENLYRDLLSRARTNEYTAEDLRQWNTRVVTETNQPTSGL